jgi:hypothetical protein
MVEYLPVYARLWVKSPVPKKGEGRKERRKEGRKTDFTFFFTRNYADIQVACLQQDLILIHLFGKVELFRGILGIFFFQGHEYYKMTSKYLVWTKST